jgi:hypothetical protein
MRAPSSRGFGWSLALRGRVREDLERDLAGLVGEIEAQVAAYFPEEEGYAVEARATKGRALEVTVRRGDFDAHVSMDGRCSAEQVVDGAVRVSGLAGSRALAAAELRGLRAAAALRWVMGAFGAGLIGLMLASMLVIPPRFAVETLFFLSGLLMVVISVLTLMTTVGIGGWLGDRIAGRLRYKAAASAASDAALHHDLQRWRALCRLLISRRALLDGGLRGQPFRNERASGSLIEA